jgi:hypothetical protein
MNGAAQAALDGLDETANRLELRWGVGRLRELVTDDLRAQFDEQKRRLSYALADGDDEQIAIQAAGMRRGWEALDKAATAAEAEPLHPLVWECQLPNDEVVAIVRTEAEARHVCRGIETYTLAEVGQLIARLGADIRAVKTAFPGSSVAEIRERDPATWSAQERETYAAKLAAQFKPDLDIPF